MFETAAYYIVLLMAAIPAVTDRIKKPALGWLLYAFLLLIFIGLRHEVGGDWLGYNLIVDNLTEQNFDELLEYGELGFYSILWSSVYLGLEVYGANVVTTAIFLYGLFKYCKIQVNPWLALFTALPSLVIVIGMGANRQAAAVGVTLLVLAGWNESGAIKKMALLVLAALFHTSAVVFGLFVIFDSHLSRVKKALLATGLFVVVAKFLADSRTVNRYQNFYVDADSIIEAPGAIQQILLVAIPAIIFLILSARNRTFRMQIPHWEVLRAMSLLAIALLPMALVYSLAASRISFYLFPVSLAVLSALPETFPVSYRAAVKILVVLYGFLTLGLWLNFANTSFAWMPYNNFLFLSW